MKRGGLHGTEVASHPENPGLNPSDPEIFSEVNKRRWLEVSGQWLENVDQTHL